MTTQGKGYFSKGLWTAGYWNDSFFSERVHLIGRKGFPIATAQPTSLVVNVLDDGTQAATGILADAPLAKGGNMLPESS